MTICRRICLVTECPSQSQPEESKVYQLGVDKTQWFWLLQFLGQLTLNSALPISAVSLEKLMWPPAGDNLHHQCTWARRQFLHPVQFRLWNDSGSSRWTYSDSFEMLSVAHFPVFVFSLANMEIRIQGWFYLINYLFKHQSCILIMIF